MLERWVRAGAPRDASGGGSGPSIASCAPGSVGACACFGGGWGTQLCTDAGIYTTCDCGGAGGADVGFAGDVRGGDVGGSTGGDTLEQVRDVRST